MDRVTECTSGKFEGYAVALKQPCVYIHLMLYLLCVCVSFFSAIALMHPKDSWVGRWQRVGTSYN